MDNYKVVPSNFQNLNSLIQKHIEQTIEIIEFMDEESYLYYIERKCFKPISKYYRFVEEKDPNKRLGNLVDRL